MGRAGRVGRATAQASVLICGWRAGIAHGARCGSIARTGCVGLDNPCPIGAGTAADPASAAHDAQPKDPQRKQAQRPRSLDVHSSTAR
jgi:hypothetical protein